MRNSFDHLNNFFWTIFFNNTIKEFNKGNLTTLNHCSKKFKYREFKKYLKNLTSRKEEKVGIRQFKKKI